MPLSHHVVCATDDDDGDDDAVGWFCCYLCSVRRAVVREVVAADSPIREKAAPAAQAQV